MPQNASSRRESRRAWRDEIERMRNVLISAMMKLNEADDEVSAGAFARAADRINEAKDVIREGI